MTKHLFACCAAALWAPFALAQTPQAEVITHLDGLDVEVSAMGVPTATTEAGGELVGIRAVRVRNNTEGMVTCEFHVPADARATTSAPPVFTVNPDSQRVERVPGDYSPDQPFAELTCRRAEERIGTSTGAPAAAETPAATEPAR
jgi:hypothetical protein